LNSGKISILKNLKKGENQLKIVQN